MNPKMKIVSIVILALFFVGLNVSAQSTERTRPAEWENLVFGGRFMDRFLPMPLTGELTSDTWGADAVVPRYTQNGLENRSYSFWGGNTVRDDDGKYHLFVCGWLENSPRGHMFWGKSTLFHAVADNSFGPYKVADSIGPGHNPEIFPLKDGRYVIYVIDGYYIGDGLAGPWEYNKFDFQARDRKIIEGLSNLSFAQREDGTYLMVCRGGGIWFSETGISPYYQVSDKRVYPPVKGRFEDPVVWKTNIQYHIIVNDWLGRIAWYLRSKDGIHWKTDPGEAYLPGLAKYEDGTVADWFKYERIKVMQDAYGRATQAHFAVIDTLKRQDLPNDNHSSKHICIPLTVGRLITILNKKEIHSDTKTIDLKIEAEEGFDPLADIDLESLRFGASEEVNFGRGSKILKTRKSDKDLILTFNGEGNGLTDENFAAKLLGKTSSGNLLFGYARLPGVNYIEPALSARKPEITLLENGMQLDVEVQNFGQVPSGNSKIKVCLLQNGDEKVLANGDIKPLKPFEKTIVSLKSDNVLKKGESYKVRVILISDDQIPVTLDTILEL